MRALTKLLIPTIILAATLPFSKRASAQQTTDYSTQTSINFSAAGLAKTALTKEAVFNPFHRPNAISTISYGDGDVDNDGDTDIDDYNLMVSGTQNDQSDVDGDGIPSTQSDIITLENHLQYGTIRPGDWNNLQTSQQRQGWTDKMLVIDKTNEFDYIKDVWDCHHFATQDHVNFFGYDILEPEHDTGLPEKFDSNNNGKFNLPIYYVHVDMGEKDHAINAILVGDNPLNFWDWYFFEPQDDKQVNIGDIPSMPDNCRISLQSIRSFGFQGEPRGDDLFYPFILIKFNIANGKPQLEGYDEENLLLTRPDNPVFVENTNIIPQAYILNQNFPNPFNPQTTISFTLSKPGEVDLTIYNITGQKIQALVDEYMPAGNHTITWDASDDPSGIYFSRLKGQGFDNSRKMLKIK